MKIITSFLFSIFFLTAQIFSQSPEKNHEKYWYYRYRLINNFTLVGDCQGCSLPAARRYLNPETNNYFLDWGDGQDLGWYIGILATEYGLLKKNNQDASATIKELYYALEAFNRLDFNAEKDWGDPDGNYNGFFIRDDVVDYRVNGINDDFVQKNLDHFNSPSVQTQLPPVIECKSIYGAHHRDFGCCTEENSQDNVIHLMMGLSLVNEFVDEDAVYDDGTGPKPFSRDGETKILYEARTICNDVVNWIRIHSWIVKNAVTGNNVEEGACCPYLISYGFAEAACKITNKNDFTHLVTGLTCFDYHDHISIPDLNFWTLIQGPAFLAAASMAPGTDHLIGILAAVGNSWYTLPGPPFVVNTTPIALSTYFYNTIPNKRQDKEYLPLLRQVLHGGINLVPDNVYLDLINSAPCLGPYNLGGGNYPNYEWSSSHRFRNPEHRGESDPGSPGEYYGIDYMLLFNLYCLAQEDYLSAYYNLMDRNITIDFPFSAFDFGSHSLPLTIEAFNSITMSSVVHGPNFMHNGGDLTLRAGREIALLPGFSVEQGADFAAYIDPFECSGGDYVRAANDTTKQPTVYNGPTDFVYYASAGKNSPVVSPTAPSVSPLVSSKATEQNNISPISIIPNPSTGIFTFTCYKPLQTIEIIDVLGNVVYKSENPNPKSEINISSYPKGIYFLKAYSGAGKIYTEKVVVQ